MKILSTWKIFSSLVLILTSSILAQGTLRGTVTDSLTHDPLVGANVYFLGTAIGAATDIDGNYNITKIPLGHYRIKVSYIGYKSKEISVNITSEKSVLMNVRLASEILQGKEVVISAQALGQAAAINQQLSSNTIVDVVSQQKIQELPDANAAESLGRLPGVSLLRSGGEANKIVLRGLSPQFATVTVDGVKLASTDANDQGIDLSTISQGSLAGIELYKALTSDKDADAIAGTVNLVTKKAPSERKIRLEAFGDYNALDKSANQYVFNGNYGERFFNDVVGVQLEGHVEQRIRSSESTDYTYDFNFQGGNNWEITAFQPQYINEMRRRTGGSVLLDFNTPDNGNIKFNTVYNRTSRNFLTSYRTYAQSGGVTYDYRLQKENIDIFNTSIHGDNTLLGFTTDWNLSFSQSQAKTPFDYEMNFDESSALASNGDIIAGMKNVPAKYDKGPVTAWIPYAVNNWQSAFFNQANDNSSGNVEKIRTGYIDLLKNYSIGSNITGAFKFGAKYSETGRSRFSVQSRSNYYLYAFPQWTRLPDGTFAKKDLSNTPFSNLIVNGARISMSNFLDPNPPTREIYGEFALNPLVSKTLLELWRNININGYISPNGSAEYIPNIQNNAENFYDLTERTTAGYLMNTLNFGRELTVILGVRVESDNNDYSSNYMNTALSGFPFPQSGTILDTTVNHKETNLFPNLQVLVRPTGFMNVRLAAYKALARPDFNYRLAKLVAYQGSGASLYIGNPQLKNAIAWNYEIQTQFYGNDIGLFSISAFYKDIKNMFQYINGAQLPGPSQALFDSLGIQWKSPLNPTTQFNFYYPYNSDRPTKVWGFEVEHQANFRFLPGLLQNIVLNYNFSVVRSETWAPTVVVIKDTVIDPLLGKVVKSRNQLTEVKQKLQDQPEFFGNISLGYDIDGFSFRIALFHQGKYNTTFSSDSRSDGEQDSYTRVDIALKQQVTDDISVLLNLNNITNALDGNLYYDRILGVEVPNTSNKYGMTGELGVRVNL